ncbi:MAG: heparinase II/III family protein [Gammaproteobacteria bacterium]|nr:heparinase II/III family protein [Gammaproteobacteria bacterium]MDH5239207.1 heparinase II/III family protein [Gammaproteobacteria bacterium]MDH5259927.1 heparinase II/III family protein [Gammaproteobacteria bacterium]
MIWMPLWSHYHVGDIRLRDTDLVLLRQSPDDATLSELSRMETTFALDLTGIESVRMARQLQGGIFEVPGIGSTSISIPFSGSDYDQIPEAFRLRFASLYAPMVLLLAYDASGDESYFDLCLRILMSWAQHDRSTILPHGLQWNDHAIASTAYVLTRFWYEYRGRDDYDPETGRLLVSAVGRISEFLMKDSFYNAATNHGIMQNLALLHLSVAFPDLPRSGIYRARALQRLAQQMTYYLSPEGAILEHSPGYHQYGLNLLADYARYQTLIGIQISKDWASRYQRAVDFYAVLRRGDETLPKFGDTNGPARGLRVARIDDEGRAMAPEQWMPDETRARTLILPVSGFAVWWDRHESGTDASAAFASQLAMSWSRFPSLAHKHSDDLAITLWRADGDWIIGPGYWPYWSERRKNAIDWSGMNAPHFTGYGSNLNVESRLIGQHYSKNLAILDVIRQAEDHQFRRQVIRYGLDNFLILDSNNFNKGQAGDRDARAVWTSSPGSHAEPTRGADAFAVRSSKDGVIMLLQFASDGELKTDLFNGNAEPFLGWTFDSGKFAKAPAVQAVSAGARWVISHISFRPSLEQADPAPILMEHWSSPTSWTAVIQSGLEVTKIKREGARLVQLHSDKPSEGGVTIDATGKEVEIRRSEIIKAYNAAMRDFPRFRPLLDYRLRATIIVAVLFFVLEVLLGIIHRINPHLSVALRYGEIMGFFALGFWLEAIYLV